MAKNWYPVIDILTCVECGTCVDFCPNGVYDKSIAPTPVVVNPQNCVDHCYQCGNRCPVGAITYVGDDTGWTSPALEGEKTSADAGGCCCCGGDGK